MSIRLIAGAAMLPVALSLTVGGCAARLDTAPRGYTCCNLRETDGWITRGNVLADTRVMPAGSRAELVYIKRGMYVYGTIDAASVALSNEGARSEAETQHWIRQLVTREDPRPKIAAWPADVQAAVHVARVLPGMTRDQVLVSLAYPDPALTPDLAATTWRYHVAGTEQPVELVFDGERLVRVAGSPAAVARVVAQPR